MKKEPHRFHVRRGARHEFARPGLVVIGKAKVLDMVVEHIAQPIGQGIGQRRGQILLSEDRDAAPHRDGDEQSAGVPKETDLWLV